MSTSGPSLQLKWLYGLKSDNPQIYHIDEHKVVYIAGHNIVTYNVEDKTMQYVPGQVTSSAINRIAISPMRRYLAISETETTAICWIYDTQTMRRKQILRAEGIQATEYVAMAFASGAEHKFCVTISGAPDWSLTFWNWDRPKALQTLELTVSRSISQVEFNPIDHNKGFVITGTNLFEWYKIREDKMVLKTDQMPAALSSSNYVCQAWTQEGNLLVGTDAGQVAVLTAKMENLSVLSVGNPTFAIQSIIPFYQGFLVGGFEARIYSFQLNLMDKEQLYRPRPMCFEVDDSYNASVRSMSISLQTEEQLIVALDNAQIQITRFDTNNPGQECNWSHLITSFHNGAITGLDVCVRKTIIVTCGTDRTVRVWNYMTKQQEVCTQFNEDPLCVAIHPSGFHVVVGFDDKVRMMNILTSVIRFYKEIPIKQAREIKFCHGGHLFAVASGMVIQVYNFYTAECPPNFYFKGHSGKVKRIAWTENDTGFASTGIDGSVFEWKLYSKSAEAQHIQDFFQKGTCFHGIVYEQNKIDGKSGTIFTVGSDGLINEIFESNAIRTYDTGECLGAIYLARNRKILMTGVNDPGHPGSIRCYPFNPFDHKATEYQAHAGAVERIAMSYDDTHLFSIGSDGTLCIFEVKDRDMRRRERELIGMVLSNELIITKGEIDDFIIQIETLKASKLDVLSVNKLQLDRAVQEKQDLIEKLKEQVVTDAQAHNQRYDSLADEKKELEIRSEAKQNKRKEELVMEKGDMDNEFQGKIMVQVARYEDLKDEKIALVEKYEDKIAKLEQEQSRSIQELENAQAAVRDDKDQEINGMEEDLAQLKRKFDEIERQITYDNDRVYQETKEFGWKEVREIRGEASKHKGGLSIETKKYKVIQDTMDRMDTEMKSYKEAIKDNESSIELLKKDKGEKRQEISQRDITIAEKEKRIYELKRKNQELEKFKFVLDYKIKELKREIIPREEEIAKMKEQTAFMDKQLKKFNRVNENLGIFVEDLRKRQEDMQNQTSKHRARLREANNGFQCFRVAMEECIHHIQDPKKLKHTLIKIYRQYVKNDSKPKSIDTSMQTEYKLQRSYLVENTISLKKELEQQAETRKMDSQRIMKDNMTLIQEIYELREKVTALRTFKRQAEILIQKSPKANMHLLTTPRNFRQLNMTMPEASLIDIEHQSSQLRLDNTLQQIEIDVPVEEGKRLFTNAERLDPIDVPSDVPRLDPIEVPSEVPAEEN